MYLRIFLNEIRDFENLPTNRIYSIYSSLHHYFKIL